MSFVSMIGSVKRLDELVNICGESDIFQPDNVSNFYSNMEQFSIVSEENPYSSPLAKLKNAIYACGAKIEDVDVSKFHISRSRIDKYVNYFSEKIESLVDKKREIHSRIAGIKEEMSKLEHFFDLDKTIEEIVSCEYIRARFGKIPLENYAKFDEIAEENQKRGIDLLFFDFDTDNEYKWGVYFANKENLEEVDRIFSGMRFKEIEMIPYNKAPSLQTIELKRECNALYRETENIEREISEFWISQKDKCMQFYKKIQKLCTYFEMKSYAARYGNSFILVGWIPKDKVNSFKERISSVKSVEYSFDEGSNLLSNSPPVKLKNNKFFSPFEFFVSMYGVPGYNELDPTPFVAITYTILFGIMFADLGQGLLVSLVGWFMWKWKRMALGRALIPCGISSAIFGTLFGSVFGFEHALDPFYKSVFGLHEKPIEVMDPSSSDIIIYSAVAIGIILLIISMALGVYSKFHRKDFGEAIFGANGICGLVFYTSMVFAILDMIMFNTGIVNGLYVSILLVLPLVLIMFKEVIIKLIEKRNDWKPESWADYISQNFFELFEVVLSYVTNTMSFLRVGAFVLVHAGMMLVVFTIAQMFSGGIGYVIAIVLGNIIVAVLEALLSGIQVLRLEFYEMFSKFFDGQGRPYTPVTATESNI